MLKSRRRLPIWQRGSLVYQLRTRKSTTGASRERDELAERRCAALPILAEVCRKTRVRVFRSLVLPVLLYSCETWTLTGELRKRLNSFGTMSLRRILGYRWHDMSNDLVVREAGLRQVTCIVRERQLLLSGQVAAEFPTHRILSCRDPRGWTMMRGRAQG